ncbi:hypothetical protein EV360DRAFT_90936 [Lentinula raphanica]|nr:hypothetical protein EV360DRAFT_90936 [Lentinula raphanica]
MASSSKSSLAKRPLPKPPADATPLPRKKLSVRPVDSLNFDLLHRVSFDNSLRELGKPPTDSDALFLPASAGECSVLVNRWKHLPNTASPAFSLPRYTHPEDVNFREVLEQNTEDIRPDSFYPRQLVTFCSTFSGGPFSRAEGFHLYQAMAFLQQGFARIIRGHLAKTEIHRRLLSFTALPAFSDSLEYYQLYWHNHHNCPLFAPLLVILLCEFCEEHLTSPEYAARVYNTKIRDGPGMSIKTRDRLMEDITELFDLQDLAIPLPLDPSTREGQLILSVMSQGSRVDRISHPVSNASLRPDPAFQVTVSKPPVAKPRLRPLSPDYDSPGLSKPSRPAQRTSRPPRKLPVSSLLIDVDAEEPSSSEVFKGPEVQDVLVLRQSIARAAKSRPAEAVRSMHNKWITVHTCYA